MVSRSLVSKMKNILHLVDRSVVINIHRFAPSSIHLYIISIIAYQSPICLCVFLQNITSKKCTSKKKTKTNEEMKHCSDRSSGKGSFFSFTHVVCLYFLLRAEVSWRKKQPYKPSNSPWGRNALAYSLTYVQCTLFALYLLLSCAQSCSHAIPFDPQHFSFPFRTGFQLSIDPVARFQI